jgi:site-specific recombinase XerD
VKYIDERNKNSLTRLDAVKSTLPPFCNSFFLGVAQTTSPLTRLNYAYDLGVFFNFLRTETETFNAKAPSDFAVTDLNKIEMFHVELFAEWLGKTNHERGKARKLSCLRSFFSYFFKRGEIEKNILPNIDLPKLHQKNIIRLDNDEAKRIISSAETGENLTKHQMDYHRKNGFRDTVILSFFLSTGVRVSELVGLDVRDLDLKNKLFRITRKGGNETVLYLTDDLCKLLYEYLSSRFGASHDVKSTLSQPLFVGPNGHERLGVRSVQNLVKKYALNAAPLKKISPHKLRSTFGTKLYRATGDIYAVADVLGHANVNTTRKHYAEITDDVKKRAIAAFAEMD